MTTRARGSQRHQRTTGGAIRRAFGVLAFLPIASRVPRYARLIWALARDERTPPERKAILLGALGYVAIGRDLIPDEIPVVGGLDDLIVVVLAVDLFLDGVPEAVLEDKLADLRIDRAAYETDVASIRRLTPRPIRRTIRRIPEVAGFAAEALRRSGLGPRIRGWITKEDSIA